MIIHSLLCPKSATVIIDICTRQFHIPHRVPWPICTRLHIWIEQALSQSSSQKQVLSYCHLETHIVAEQVRWNR